MKKSLLALAALSAMGSSAGVAFARRDCDEPRGHALRALDGGGLLANIDSATLNANAFMQAFGNAVVADGKVSLAANPTAADVIRVMLVPAGTKVSAIQIANTDLDTNGSPTFVHSIGYAYVDGSSASAAYFAAAGQTNLQAANDGKLYRKFDAITFDKDAYITMTVGTAAATFAAGDIWMTAIGEARGVK